MVNEKYMMYFMNIQRDTTYLMNKGLKELSLGRHDVRVIQLVNTCEGLTQNEIADRIKEDKITISKSVKKLVDKGYLEKRKSESDRRNTYIYMTEEGRKNRYEILKIIETVNLALVKNLNDEEQNIFLDMLRRVGLSLEKEAERIHVE